MTRSRSRRSPRAFTPSRRRTNPHPPDDDPAPARRPNLLIRASAGTGKTYQLSGQFIDRLRITEPDRILAVTFTRAAAGEILERVLLRLAEAALEPKKLRELAEQIDPLHDAPLTREECLERLATLTRQLHRVRIGTIDSFFIQLAQCFSLELGLSPGWTIMESIEEDQLLTAAIERLLHNNQQNGGQGGEVARLLNLLSKGDSARNVSSLLRSTVRSFSTAYQETRPEAWRQVPEPRLLSAEELQEAVEALDRVELPESWEEARAQESQSARDGLWEEFLKKGIAAKVAAGETTYNRKLIPAEAFSVYEQLVSHARAVLVRQLASRTRVTWDVLDRLHAELTALKQQHRGWTFDDITRSLSRGWREAAIDQLDFRLDASLEHLLLDEFQDTSVPQWQALEPLAQRMASNPAMSLFCVGDQKQAIYGWRGGVAELFDALRDRLPHIQEKTLDRSYRSSPAVIAAVNRLGAELHRHPAERELGTAISRWQKRFVNHETAQTNLPGWVTLETPPVDKEEDVLAFAVQRIQETHERIPAASIGVLAVTNETVAHLARELRRQGIDVSEEGGRTLNDSVAVQLILSLLHLTDHPGDTVAQFHVATSPLGEAIGLTEEARPEEVHHLAARLRRDLMERGYGRCVAEWARFLAPYCDSRGVGRLTQLVNIAHDYTPHATLRTLDFIKYVEAQEVHQPSAARVRLMTIHRAKGLEFDIVFLPELDGKLLPHPPPYVSRRPAPVEPPDAVIHYANEQLVSFLPPALQSVFQADKLRRYEERLCVLYVAVTRARYALHLLLKPSSSLILENGGQKETKLPQTLAGLLRAALTEGGPLPPGTVLTISGDPEWHCRVPDLAGGRGDAAAKAPPPPLPPLRIELAPPRRDSIAQLEEVQPSRHGARRMRMTDVLTPPSAARARGSLIHAWFEQIEWLDNGPPDDELLRRIAYRWELPQSDVQQALRDFRAMLDSPPIASLLSRHAYRGPQGLFASVLDRIASPQEATLRVRTEHRFAVPVDKLLIRGSMDRLVLLEHNGKTLAADVCDYKTDLLQEGLDAVVVEERLEGYRQQLRWYARAAAHQFDVPADRVTARLILLGPGRVEPVPFP